MSAATDASLCRLWAADTSAKLEGVIAMNVIETTIGGRAARIQTIRVRHANKAWGYYDRVVGRFLDNNETFSMGAAEFEKWADKLERETTK